VVSKLSSGDTAADDDGMVMAEEKGGWEGDRGGVHDLAEAKPAMVKK
jgi:hypothetical protein